MRSPARLITLRPKKQTCSSIAGSSNRGPDDQRHIVAFELLGERQSTGMEGMALGKRRTLGRKCCPDRRAERLGIYCGSVATIFLYLAVAT